MSNDNVQKVQIILPQGAFDGVDKPLKGEASGLRYLTKMLIRNGFAEAWPFTGLGGEYGYGIEFENDIFQLHPYCWCGKDDCPWCAGEAPNFWYKPTNYKVRWYKWIGRDMKYENPNCTLWPTILVDCLHSLDLVAKGEQL